LCREHAVRVRDEYERFTAAGGQVAVVTMGRPEQARQFREYFKLPFPLLSDPEQAAYRAFHVPRGGLLSVAGPGMWAAGAQSLVKHGVGQIIGDPYQLPGSFVIDRAGTVVFAHRGKTSADVATNEELIGVLRRLQLES
jgi:alkyl-hydroperoxide reductase/thiol specific antioxidant family protein